MPAVPDGAGAAGAAASGADGPISETLPQPRRQCRLFHLGGQVNWIVHLEVNTAYTIPHFFRHAPHVAAEYGSPVHESFLDNKR